MYKVFNNYPKNCPLSEVLRITMENIKTFICNIAPNTDFTATEDINTPVPWVNDMPDYIKDTTPLIFYSNVVDNSTNSAFNLDDFSEFKISHFADINYPVYCIFYSWMPCPILIFVSKSGAITWSDYTKGLRPDDGFSSRQSICVAFDLSIFNLDANNKISKRAKFRYTQRHPMRSGIGVDSIYDGLLYEDATIKSSPILILDPFYHMWDIVADDIISSNVDSFSFAMSLYNKTICFYFLKNQNYVANTTCLNSFISVKDTQLVGGCDLMSPEEALICKSDGVAFLSMMANGHPEGDEHLEVNDRDKERDRTPYLCSYGHTVRIGDPYSFVPERVPLVIFGAYADSNIKDRVCNLWHSSYKPNFGSYRNFKHFNNVEKRAQSYMFKGKLAEDDPDRWVGGLGWTSNILVPTIITSFNSSGAEGDGVNYDDWELDNYSIPHFPTLTNGDNIGEYEHNYSLLLSMARQGDPKVFTKLFPFQTNNVLNNHFIMYPIHIYIKREPLDTNTYSIYCKLNFVYSCQRLYDDDNRMHEYNYLGKKFIGISNRYTGLLFLVDDYKELII